MVGHLAEARIGQYDRLKATLAFEDATSEIAVDLESGVLVMVRVLVTVIDAQQIAHGSSLSSFQSISRSWKRVRDGPKPAGGAPDEATAGAASALWARVGVTPVCAAGDTREGSGGGRLAPALGTTGG